MTRFLRYSLENQKKIRAVLTDEQGIISYIHLTVTELNDSSFTYVASKHKNGKTLPLSMLLSADYARGDNGEGKAV